MADNMTEQHIHCGTPECCGQCETTENNVKKDENTKKDDKKND